MSVNLQKGQKVDLTKSNPGLKKIMVGLGWDEAAPPPSSGGLGGLFKKPKENNIDCDASAILISTNTGKLHSFDDVVYFGKLRHRCGAVIHMGDNLTGAGEGDDEQIMVDLSSMPESYNKIIFVVNIYQAVQRNQHFGMIQNAFIRLVNAENNTEICKYNLSENYDNMTAMIFGEIYSHQGEWKFNAIGQGTTDVSITSLSNQYK